MKPGQWIALAGALAFLGVALGAFGAHALANRFGDYEKGIWQTAVFYHLIHALALFAFGILLTAIPELRTDSSANWIGSLFAVGILLFSGSLYTLALSGIRMFGAVTPLGGVSFLVAWALVIRLGLKA